MPETSGFEAQISLEIPFHDLDPMDIVWHGNYARYFELARCHLLERFDYNYEAMRASNYAWPIINLQVKYLRPLRFRQRIQVQARILEWAHRLRIRYQITDEATGGKLTEGLTDQVAVDLKTGEMLMASPQILYQKLGLIP